MVKYRHISPHVHIIPRPLCNNAPKAPKGLLTLHNDAHQASAGPLSPVNYENDDHPAHANMNTVLKRPYKNEDDVHFAWAGWSSFFIIDGPEWARRSLMCIIVQRQ